MPDSPCIFPHPANWNSDDYPGMLQSLMLKMERPEMEGVWVPGSLLRRGSSGELPPRNTHITQFNKKEITFYNVKPLRLGAG